MTVWLPDLEQFTIWVVWGGVALAVVMAVAVMAGRALVALSERNRRRLERHYRPVIDAALTGDADATRTLLNSPVRHRILIATLLITPLIDDRAPARIAATRAVVDALDMVAAIDGYLHSRLWWRRALVLRALGLIQERSRTAAVVAALDDTNADVRGAALDALADLHDPASLPALVARMHDPALHYRRRTAALAAFGSQVEPLVLQCSRRDPQHRVNYAQVLAVCGTAASRQTLCAWAGDTRPEVSAAAFDALAWIGLDNRSAILAIEALDNGTATVRRSAARALNGWMGIGDAPRYLGRHLDDAWVVAAQAARSLRSMGRAGRRILEEAASRPDLTGRLARQMLWDGARR